MILKAFSVLFFFTNFISQSESFDEKTYLFVPDFEQQQSEDFFFLPLLFSSSKELPLLLP